MVQSLQLINHCGYTFTRWGPQITLAFVFVLYSYLGFDKYMVLLYFIIPNSLSPYKIFIFKRD